MQLLVVVTPAANRALIHRRLEQETFAATILDAVAPGRGGKLATVLMAVEEARVEAAVSMLRTVIGETGLDGESELFLLAVHHFTKT